MRYQLNPVHKIFFPLYYGQWDPKNRKLKKSDDTIYSFTTSGVGVPAVPPGEMSPRTCGPSASCPPRTCGPRASCPPLGSDVPLVLLTIGSDATMTRSH